MMFFLTTTGGPDDHSAAVRNASGDEQGAARHPPCQDVQGHLDQTPLDQEQYDYSLSGNVLLALSRFGPISSGSKSMAI